jgi:putative membrane protein
MNTTKTLSILILIAATAFNTALAKPHNNGNNGNNRNNGQQNGHGNQQPGNNEDDDDDEEDDNGGTQTSFQQYFLNKAATDSLLEIALGQLAQTHSMNAGVQQFGQQLVTDHTAALQQIQQLATTLGITLTDTFDSNEQAILNMLSQLNGQNFDVAFLQFNIQSHIQDIQLFYQAAVSASDPAVRAFAAAQIPVLAQHLQMALTLWQTIGGGTIGGTGGTGDDDGSSSGDDNDENEGD